MNGRHPLAILGACWMAVGLLFLVADCLLKPTPPPVSAPATPTRIAVTVLPTAFVFSTPTVVPVPTMGDLLPMTATTRAPTLTSTRVPTPEPTVTPDTTRAPVQKG